MENMKIVNIDIEKLYPHPENPRKDLGDLTELTESIRANGIMQNLTVIRGHYVTEDEFAQMAKDDGADVAAARLTYKEMPINDRLCIDGDSWTIVIGHRRHAAAVAAGLAVLPCRVVDIPETEQVAMMLTENMQRNSLTVAEQAYGFQLMFDLGNTAEEIAEKTGMHKSTVYHRLNLAKLDRRILEEKEDSKEFQFTLTDLYELEKILDVEKRNEILKASNCSNNLRYRVEEELRQIKRRATLAGFKEEAEAAGIQYSAELAKSVWSSDYEDVKSFSLDKEYADYSLGLDPGMDTEKLRYADFGAWFYIKKKKPEKKAEEAEEDPWKKTQANKRKLENIHAGFRKKASEFAIKMALDKKVRPDATDEELRSEIWEYMKEVSANVSRKKLIEEVSPSGKSIWEMNEEEKNQAELILHELSIERQMLLVMGHNLSLDTNCPVDYYGVYQKEEAERLKMAVSVLMNYGFVPDTEERMMISGLSPLYKSSEK